MDGRAAQRSKEQELDCSQARHVAHLLPFLVREGMLETNPAKLVSTPRWKRNFPKHLSVEEAISLSNLRMKTPVR